MKIQVKLYESGVAPTIEFLKEGSSEIFTISEVQVVNYDIPDDTLDELEDGESYPGLIQDQGGYWCHVFEAIPGFIDEDDWVQGDG